MIIVDFYSEAGTLLNKMFPADAKMENFCRKRSPDDRAECSRTVGHPGPHRRFPVQWESSGSRIAVWYDPGHEEEEQILAVRVRLGV